MENLIEADNVEVHIDPHHLRVHELHYEILLRGQKPKPTADLCRIQLRGLLKRQYTYPFASPLAFDEDSKQIRESLEQIREIFDDSDQVLTTQCCQRLRSRLNHLQRRLGWLIATNPEEVDVRQDLDSDLAVWQGMLDEVADNEKSVVEPVPSPSLSRRSSPLTVEHPFIGTAPSSVSYSHLTEQMTQLSFVNHTHNDPTSPHYYPNALTYRTSSPELGPGDIKNNSNPFKNPSMFGEPKFCSTPNQVAYLPEHNSKSVPIYKWGISFSGNKNSLDVVRFLERVNELRIARGVSYQQLFESAVDLFEEPALSWYRSIRHNVNSWYELELKLKATFISPLHDEKLLEEIKSFKQVDRMSTTAFISTMRMKFSHLLRPFSIYDQLTIIRRNLLPSLNQQLALVEINTYEELEYYCRLIAKNSPYNVEVKSGNTTRRNQADVSTVNDNSDRVMPQNKTRTSEQRPVQSGKVSSCWNCRAGGHWANACPRPRALFCYGCGQPNVMRASCGKCNPHSQNKDADPKNGQSGSQQGATALPLDRRPTESQRCTGTVPKVLPKRD